MPGILYCLYCLTRNIAWHHYFSLISIHFSALINASDKTLSVIGRSHIQTHTHSHTHTHTLSLSLTHTHTHTLPRARIGYDCVIVWQITCTQSKFSCIYTSLYRNKIFE